MAERNVWVRGQRVRLTVTFYDESGALADPTTRTIRVTDPSVVGGNTTDYTGGQLVNVSLGVWRYYLDTAGLADTFLGDWTYAGIGAGAIIAAAKKTFTLVSEKKP